MVLRLSQHNIGYAYEELKIFIWLKYMTITAIQHQQ